MSTFVKDWFTAMGVYLLCVLVNKALGVDTTSTHALLTAVSITIVYRLSKVYDLLKQRQCCKRE